MNELFSVIVLVYNNSKYLNECLDSVFKQKYPSIELIVVDDFSDEYDQIGVERYIELNKKGNIEDYLVYQNESNFGTVKSINCALKKAKGKYIKLLAGDDALYDENSLLSAAVALKACPCGMITSDVMRCDSTLVPISICRNGFEKKLNELAPHEAFRSLCIYNNIIAPGVFFRKDFFDVYGLFDESYRLIEDWPKWLSATQNGCQITYSPFIATKYRSNVGIGTSSNPIIMADHKRVLTDIIIPAKEEIGLKYYVGARLSFSFVHSKIVRKVYRLVFGTLRKTSRKGVKQ